MKFDPFIYPEASIRKESERRQRFNAFFFGMFAGAVMASAIFYVGFFG